MLEYVNTERPASSLNNLEVRTYSESNQDELRIIEVFGVVFGKARSLKHWNWKFKNNPYHPPLISVVMDRNGQKIAAHYAVMPLQLNIMGKSQLACQSLDTLVHPDYRMHGLFESSALHCYEQCKNAKILSVHGFPGPQSYPGFMRKLNWRRVSVLEEYSARFSLKHEFSRFLKVSFLADGLNFFVRALNQIWEWVFINTVKRRLISPLSYETTNKVPEGIDSLWKSIKDFEVYSLWKDARYLTWRYDQNPDSKFNYHVLRDSHGIVALAVTTIQGDGVFISEWMIKDKARLVSDYLLSHLKIKFGKDGKLRRLVFQGFDSGFFSDAFRSMKRGRLPQLVFGLVPFEQAKNLPGFDLASNWTVTLGDTDLF